MHHDQFVNRVFQREHRTFGIENGTLQNDVAALKIRIEPGGFVRRRAECRTGKIEGGAEGTGKGRPESAGYKGWDVTGMLQRIGKVDFEFDVRGDVQAGGQEER